MSTYPLTRLPCSTSTVYSMNCGSTSDHSDLSSTSTYYYYKFHEVPSISSSYYSIGSLSVSYLSNSSCQLEMDSSSY